MRAPTGRPHCLLQPYKCGQYLQCGDYIGVWWNGVQYIAVQYITVQYNIQYVAVQFSTVQRTIEDTIVNNLQYSALQYSTVQYSVQNAAMFAVVITLVCVWWMPGLRSQSR